MFLAGNGRCDKRQIVKAIHSTSKEVRSLPDHRLFLQFRLRVLDHPLPSCTVFFCNVLIRIGAQKIVAVLLCSAQQEA